MWMRALLLSVVLIIDDATACGYASSGLPIPQGHPPVLKQGSAYPVLPGPVTTVNNAFVTDDLLKPLQRLSGNDKTLLENLNEYAASTTDDDLCYWAFQALPPPRGGPSILHPFRGYWDVQSGQYDQDMEWVQAYGEVAVARLHSRIKKGGPVVGAMCAMGAVIAKRRCESGKSNTSKCIPAITNGTVQWPTAVSIWKVGHPDLKAAVQDWRASRTTGHFPNIEWVLHTPGTSTAHVWSGTMPKPGEINSSAMPQPGDPYPVSKGAGWGAPKIAKVVKCSSIPPKYTTGALYYCDSVPNASAAVSNIDEAYAVWSSLTGVWPPTKPCIDDTATLGRWLQQHIPTLAGANCTVAFSRMQTAMPNFDCDNSDLRPTFRDMCCSVCGGKPIPDVPPPHPSPSPPPPPPACSVCNHVYDAQRDGGGMAFEDLPDTWVCPVCGTPKGAYVKQPGGAWAHPVDDHHPRARSAERAEAQ